MDFQEPSSGPVSARRRRSRGNEEVRVVEGGAEGVGEDVAELAALVDQPGVGTLTWLGTPPGVENC